MVLLRSLLDTEKGEPVKMKKSEKETIIRITAAEPEWTLWTRDPKFVRRLRKRGYELTEQEGGGWTCSIPITRVSILRPRSSRKGRFKFKNHSTE